MRLFIGKTWVKIIERSAKENGSLALMAMLRLSFKAKETTVAADQIAITMSTMALTYTLFAMDVIAIYTVLSLNIGKSI